MALRALVISTDVGTLWTRFALSDGSPLEVPVAGRLFIDYALEATERYGIAEADVVDWHPGERLVARFAEPRDGVCTVRYHQGKNPAPRDLADLDHIPGLPPPDDNCYVLWGLCLPLHAPGEARYEPVPDEALRQTPAGIYHRVGGRWMRAVGTVSVMPDTASWLALSMDLLEGRGGYTLPGYSAERGTFICRNVVMEYGTEATPPVLLLDNVWCARNVRLENGVILGRNAFVGEGTRLSRTMVCDDTFVGEGLDLEGKIVVGRRIIDAASCSWVDIEELGIAHRIRRPSNPFSALLRFLAGASHGRRR